MVYLISCASTEFFSFAILMMNTGEKKCAIPLGKFFDCYTVYACCILQSLALMTAACAVSSLLCLSNALKNTYPELGVDCCETGEMF